MMSCLDPHINQCELEVQMIIQFQKLANQLPNAFINNESDKATNPKFLIF